MRRHPGRPQYMTVGNGSTSEHASRLAAMLDNDSGYGGSIADGATFDPTFDQDPMNHLATAQGANCEHSCTSLNTQAKSLTNSTADNERRAIASHVHQLQYNQNRTALGRAISETVDTLKKLQDMNSKWPAHYPTVQRPPPAPRFHPDPRPGLVHTRTGFDNHHETETFKRPTPRRAETTIGQDMVEPESSEAAARAPAAEPRLVTPQLSRQFSVLKIELKMEGVHQTELVHSLEKQSIASLLDGQINNSVRHLFSLRDRIEDTSSKVLITGDLNAGKSTFCNALLRRKVLPEDQQPCTSIFCEVLDCRENGGIEEVHAIPNGMDYNRHDESTYAVFGLAQLEDIVIDNEKWSQCKVYIKDVRSVDQSLLNNGVVDIALIDAPGLNNDSLKTTAVFARQEEIDVVVFVVSAANHFTLSAKEFIFNAAREKAYMFMVVNGYDNIRDKKRCQEMILKQVNHLSPATFKESSELVHFVSSNAIPVAPAGGPDGPGGSGSGSSSGGPSGDPSHDDEPSDKNDKGKGKEQEKIDDFNELEASLRRFVLEKRARSKLAPAKTYLLNVLGDLGSLAGVNKEVAQNELDRVTKELKDLEPVYEKSKKARSEAGEGVDFTIDETASDIYKASRDTINNTIARAGEQNLGVEYPGLFSVYQYADELKTAMLEQITRSVHDCEEAARDHTAKGVDGIKNLGVLHLGENYEDLTFKSEYMFRSRRDALTRQVDVDVEMSDFFDLTSLWERQEKVAGASMAVTIAGVVGGRMFGGVGWVDGALGAAKVLGPNNLRRLVIPGVVLALALGASYALSSIPHSLPRRLSQKLSAQLAELDYTHVNATRISSEVRRALKFPADKLREGLQRSVEQLLDERKEKIKLQSESDVARKYFSNLVRESDDIRSRVMRVDLEGPAPGHLGGHGV
jgi:replication fork clamp-binding protein CrfC